MPSNIKSSLIFISILSMFWISCKTDQSNNVKQTVYIQLDKDPERLNPLLYPLSQARPINQNVFLPLAEYDPFTLEYRPLLIKEIPQNKATEGYEYDLAIREEATWGDGTPITAKDYIFTLKMVLHPLTAAKSTRSYLTNITQVKINPDNNKEFTVFFEGDYSLALEAATNFDILPAHIYDPNGYLNEVTINTLKDESLLEQIEQDTSLVAFAEQINSQKYSRDVVVGAGPYRLVEWRPDEVVLLEKKENYWAKDLEGPAFKQHPDRIIFKIIPDEFSAVSQLKSGLLDLLPDVSAETYTGMQSDTLNQDYSFYDNYLMQYYFIVLNTQHPVLKHKEARRALSHCADIEKYIQLFEKGFAKKTVSFINPAKAEYNSTITPLAYDVEQAKLVLQEGGWKDTNNNGIVDKMVNGRLIEFSVEYYASGKLGADIGLMMKEDAAKAGMNIEIIKKSYALIKQENLSTGNFGMTASRLSQSIARDDPYLRFHSDNANLGGTNYPRYVNPKADDLIEKINSSSDETELKKLYDELQEIIYDDQPLIYLYVPKFKSIATKNWNIQTSIVRPGFFPNTFTYAGVMAK